MTLCLYHAQCADGFGAAWALRKHRYLNPHLPEDLVFIPARYNEPPPVVAGQVVFMLDFSYPRPTLLDLAAAAEHIIIIDHHQTAIEHLVDLPANVTTVFDTEHSGAMLTWDHLFPDVAPPALLTHIEDRDLWRFKLPFTREIMACLFSFAYDFAVWDILMASPIDGMIQEGAAIDRKHKKDLAEILPEVTRTMTIGGIRVPVANLPYTMASDGGQVLAEAAPFGAVYYDDGQQTRHFSLRSRKPDGADVARIAEGYGGGGHRHAAGFKVAFAHLSTLGLI